MNRGKSTDFPLFVFLAKVYKSNLRKILKPK